MGGLEFEGGEVAHAAGWAFVLGNDQFEWAGFGIKELAVQRVGDEDCSGMKSRVHLGEREDNLVSVRAGGNDIRGQPDTAEFFADTAGRVAGGRRGSCFGYRRRNPPSCPCRPGGGQWASREGKG